jgi:hypothetical protein
MKLEHMMFYCMIILIFDVYVIFKINLLDNSIFVGFCFGVGCSYSYKVMGMFEEIKLIN